MSGATAELEATVVRYGNGERPSTGHVAVVRLSCGKLKASGQAIEMPELLEFTLGDDEVIPGLEKAVSAMSLNECKNLVVPPHEAYGPTGYFGVVPPDATLLITVELL